MTEGIQDFRFRDNTRAPFEIAVRLRFDRFGGTVDAFSADVSLEGMFVRTDDPKPVGTLVQFEFGLGEGEERDVVQGLGDVVWLRSAESVSGKPRGMGIQFRYIDPHSRDLIHRIVSHHLSARPTSVDLPIEPAALSPVDEALTPASPTPSLASSTPTSLTPASLPAAAMATPEPAHFVPSPGRDDSGPLVFPAGALGPNSPVPKLPSRAASPPAAPPRDRTRSAAESKAGTESLGTQRLGAPRLGTERLGTERIGTERLGTKSASPQPAGAQTSQTQPAGGQPSTPPTSSSVDPSHDEDETATGARPALFSEDDQLQEPARANRAPRPLEHEPPPLAAAQSTKAMGDLDDILGSIARDNARSPSSSGMTTRSPFKPPPPDPGLPSYLSPPPPTIGRPVLYAGAALVAIALTAAGWWYRDALLELVGLAKEPAVTEISLPAVREAAPSEIDSDTTPPPVADPLTGVATTTDTANPGEQPARDGELNVASADSRAPSAAAGVPAAGSGLPSSGLPSSGLPASGLPASGQPADSNPSDPNRADTAGAPSAAAPAVGPSAPIAGGNAPIAGAGRTPSGIRGIAAQETTNASILVITADRPIQPDGFSVLRLSAPPRFVVKLQGVEQPFAGQVPSPRLRGLRSAVHRDSDPTELHLVFDLANDRARSTARLLADGRLEVRLEDG